MGYRLNLQQASRKCECIKVISAVSTITTNTKNNIATAAHLTDLQKPPVYQVTNLPYHSVLPLPT